MNLDEHIRATSDSLPEHDLPAGKRIRIRPIKRSISSLEASSLPSAPSDPDWVSPFTLPPLPTLRRNRGQSTQIQSPETRQHKRTSSSAYYAAAWGSPYATPSPNRSPTSQKLDRRSLSFEASSPLFSRIVLDNHSPSPSRIYPIKDQSSDSEPASPAENEGPGDRDQRKSQRRNWLSESETSDSDETSQAAKTPTKGKKSTGDKVGFGELSWLAGAANHQVQTSVDTITPETFNGTSGDSVTYAAPMGSTSPDVQDLAKASSVFGKPLPTLPTHESLQGDLSGKNVSGDDYKPQLLASQSFQIPKRKVMYKGKACIIALPVADRESAGLPPVMSAEIVKARLQHWLDLGYNCNGFTVGGWHSGLHSGSESQSMFPDPNDLLLERKNDPSRIRVPDQAEWDGWVEYLKEEKLRALGVTSSNSEPPGSTKSPFSSTLSRVSSTYPSMTASPPLPSMSAGSNHVRMGTSAFSPIVFTPNGLSSQASPSLASSQFGHPLGPLHGYKQSMAMQHVQPRIPSPYEYPISQPSSLGVGMRSPTEPFGRRQFSPSHVANMQSLGHILSPLGAVGPIDSRHYMHSNPQMEQMRRYQDQNTRQQQQLQSQLAQHQRHMSAFPFPSPFTEQLPRTPMAESSGRPTPEIMHPTPRSHRHNLSTALEKGISDSSGATEKRQPELEFIDQIAKQESVDTGIPEKDEIEPDESLQEDLPVLRRPETMNNGDDKSEIETNPSISGTPLLMDGKNALSSWQNLNQENGNAHRFSYSQAPATKLNVQAKEFNPTAAFSSANFSFAETSFQPHGNKTSNPIQTDTKKGHTKTVSSLSKLSVTAPAFTPSFMKQDTAENGMFSFSSPSFNVKAPEFKPSNGSRSSFEFSPINDQVNTASIFGDVVIDPNTKATRRPKVLPIVRPRSRDNTSRSSEADTDPDDDEGRPSAPADRQKRTRRVDDEGDSLPTFAESAPFTSLSMEEQRTGETDQTIEASKLHKSDDDICSMPVGSSVSGQDEEATKIESTIPGVTGKLESIEELHVEQASDDTAGQASTTLEINENLQNVSKLHVIEREDQSGGESHVASCNLLSQSTTGLSAKAPELRPSATAAESEPTIENKSTGSSETTSKSTTSPGAQDLKQSVASNHKDKPSLSALAKPFVLPHAIGESLSSPASELLPKTTLIQQHHLEVSRSAPSPPSEDVAVEHQASIVENKSAEVDGRPAQPITILSGSHTDITKPSIDVPSPPEGNPDEPEESVDEPGPTDNESEPLFRSSSVISNAEDPVPSFEEIDAVMRQFDDNPDLGVEREDTPVESAPLIDMRLPHNFRSEAPSPSPRHLNHTYEGSSLGLHGLGFISNVHRLNHGTEHVSDWNSELSPQQADKMESRAQFFDVHVNDLVDGILENRLAPIEQSLEAIHHSLTLVTTKSKTQGRRSMSTDNRESDADDEDDYDAYEGFTYYRSRSPQRRERKQDLIKSAVLEAISTNKMTSSEGTSSELVEIRAALREMRDLAKSTPAQYSPMDIKSVLEDVISTHSKVHAQQSQQANENHANLQSKVDSLESALKATGLRHVEESTLRQKAEERIQLLQTQFEKAQDQLSAHREASEEAQQSLRAFVEEKEAYLELEAELSDANAKNDALEATIEEYRVSSDEWREDIRAEKARNGELTRALHDMREQYEERLQSRNVLREQIDRMQKRVIQVMHDVAHDESEWNKREHELLGKNEVLQAKLDHEVRHREKIELEVDELDKEHKANIHFRSKYELSQQENERLQALANTLRDENKTNQDLAFATHRELAHLKEGKDDTVVVATVKLQADLDAAKAAAESIKVDSEAQIARLQSRLDHAELDVEEQKASHDSILQETREAHARALQEANEKRETALEEQHSSHERKLNDLRDRHTRALHNSSDDRHRLENHLNEKLTFSEDKIRHLENKITDLEERLEISQTACRAAVVAASHKNHGLPTPAASVVASPPHRSMSASMSLVKGTDLPEKISPQALRESILALQDQLGLREGLIEKLEADLAAVDKEAPAKVKERDTEIAMLRELLDVRLDDLQELITTLEQPKYDRTAAKDAAIRLKTQLKIEQQLKERAISGIGLATTVPSSITSSITNLAQSPRAMVAAAAWGNWRKARESSFNAISEMASNLGGQTPTRANTSTPSSLLSGIMTPPSTNLRTPKDGSGNSMSPPPPAMRPLAAAAATYKANTNGISTFEARPLRAYTAQPRSLAGRNSDMRRDSTESISKRREPTSIKDEPPSTPITPGRPLSDFGDDIDEDASPLDGKDHHSFNIQTDEEEESIDTVEVIEEE